MDYSAKALAKLNVSELKHLIKHYKKDYCQANAVQIAKDTKKYYQENAATIDAYQKKYNIILLQIYMVKQVFNLSSQFALIT